ncbi:MAG: fibronectin type III domain-containing protein, partial [Bacteroidales bacterium]
ENGNQSLFITNNGNLNLYYIDSTSSVWAYRDIQLPEAPGFQLTFDWKTIGESSYDYFKIFIGSPAVVTAGSSTVPAEVTELGRFNNKADWQSDTVTIDATYGNSVQRLYFLWRNDYSGGTNPPAAIDNISLTAITCGRPYNLTSSDHTESSTTISWTPASAQDNEWEYVVGAIGFAPEEAIPVQVSTPYIEITDLLSGRVYQIYVRTLCNGEPGEWSDPLIFFTDCAIISQLPYQENFDSWGTGTTAYPYCWKRITTYGTTCPYINDTYSSAPGALYFYANDDYNMAILPEVSTAIDIADLEVIFKMRSSSTTASMIVGVMSNPSDASTFVGLDTLKVSTTDVWENKIIKLENYTGTGKYIALKGYASSSLYVDDLSINLSRICDRPENVRIKNITQTTAQALWSPSSVAQSWEVVYGETGFNPAQATPIVATDTIYTLSNLSAATVYDVYVREYCGDAEPSHWSFITSFTTLCNALEELPYTENFDSYGTSINSFPACWTRITNNTSTNYPYLSTSYSHSTPASLYFYGTSSLYSIASLPQIPDQYEINELQLNFYSRPSSSSSFIQVGVMTDPYDNETFEVIKTITSSETIWKYNEIFFNDYEGDARFIAFRIYGANSYYYIDDVELREIPPCSYPINITVSNIVGSSAMVNWDFEGVGVPVSYDVEYCETGTEQWSAPLNTTHRNLLLSGLTENTTYDVRVKTNCETVSSSYGSTTFTTDCYTVQNLGAFETGTTSTYTIPVNNYYGYTYSQQIYTAHELGATASNISTISFKYTHNAPMTLKNSVQIYLQHTSDSMFTTTFKPTTGAVLVYEGPLNCVNGWNKFILNTPFQYNGTDHLLMTILDNSGGYNSSSYTFATHSATAKSIHVYTDGAPYSLGNVSGGNIISERNDIRFGACNPNQTCIAPNLFVGTITPNQINIFWAAGSTETSWEVEYKLSTETNWTPAGVASTTTFAINNLIPNNLYDIRVRSVCGTEYSTWVTVSGTTPCVAVTVLPYEEDFDSYTSTSQVPNCWTKNSTYTSSSYPSLNTINFTAPYGFYFYSSNATYTLGVLPELDATIPVNTLHAIFKLRSSDTNYVAKIGVMSDPNDISTFTLIQAIRVSATNTWEDHEVYFTDYTGTGQYIAFLSDRREIAATNNFYIDELYVNTAPSCRRPTHITIGNITTTTADVTWEDNQTAEYVVEYGPTPFEHGTGTMVTTSNTTITLDNLTPNTPYMVYVRSVCSGVNQSDWSFVKTFRTECVNITTLPFEEDFDTYGTTTGTFPYCWSRPVTYLNYPSIVSTYSVSSPASLRFQSQTQTPTYAITPAFDIELNTLQLSFSLKAESISYSGTITVGVMSNPNDTATFEPVQVINPVTSWTAYEINLNEITLTGLGNYIAFKHSSNRDNFYYWLDDVLVDEIPTCIKVTNVRSNNLTSTGATILWHPASGTDNSWEYVCDTVGFNHESATPVVVTDTTVVLTGLQPHTTYSIYVRTVCADGTSRWSTVYNFTTECANYTIPFFEDFAATTFPPACWNRYSGLASSVFTGTPLSNATSGWSRVTNGYGLTTPHAKVNIWSTGTKYWLVTPSIDLAGTLNPTLIFRLALTDNGNNSVIENLTGQPDDQFMVIVSTDDGATWSANNATIWNNNANGDYAYNSIATHGETVSINLAQYVGQRIKIAFYGESTVTGGDNDVHIDSVRVEEIEACNTPSNLIVSTITTSGATIAWTAGGGETSWVVEYKKSTVSDYTSTTVTTPTYTFADLDPATLYQVRVKAICDVASESAYLTGQFTTETPVVTYTITATAGDGGTIDPSGDIMVAEGANKTFTITPNQGYEISMVTVDQTTELGNVSSYTFNNMVANHTIDAQFQTTGIENQDLLNSVTLAPNPAEQFVKLTIDHNRITVKEAGIYDAYGKLIQLLNIMDNETTINLNHFSNGVYFIRLISDEGMITKKLIKK